MLAIAMTLIAGAAAWSFVRSQAGNSEGALQNGAIATNNMLSEHFAVIDMYYSTAQASGSTCPGAPGTTCSAVFWVYNTGSVTFQIQSVRLYDSAGLLNLFYNYTGTGGSKVNQVYDLRSSLATKCKTAAASYEAPSLTSQTVRTTNEQAYTLTVPGTASSCPSFGPTPFGVGTTYTVVVTGIYGNSVSFSQQE